MSMHKGALRLNDWGVIRAVGEDAASFLNGQLTQDLLHLGSDQARLAGYCSAKGRLLATLIAWRCNDNDSEILLALPAELLAPTLKRLSMFVMRAKCKLSDASAEVALWGLLGDEAAGALPASPWACSTQGGATFIRLPQADAGTPRLLLAQAAAEPAPAWPELSAADWRWEEVRAGLAWIQSATVEQFVPQMLNLELLEGVSFKKGCYPGQEVVARSQYRGTLKRRTYLFEVDGSAAAGQEIFHSEDPGQPAGIVALAATREGRSLLLAETKIAALASGSLHLGSAEGATLRPQTLPYELPSNLSEPA